MTVRRRLLSIGLVFAAVYLATPRLFVFDDPYITLHSADVWLQGRDPIFGVPPLVGITSPAYLALLIGLRLLRLPPLETLRVASALGTTCFLFGVWTLGADLSPLRRAALALVTVTSGLCWIQLTNGLETGWAMAVLLWMLIAARADRPYWVALLAGVLPFLRPDLAITAGLVLIWSALKRPWNDVVSMAAIAAFAAAPWLLWMHHDAGGWLPNTIDAKRLFFAEGCRPLAAKLSILSTGVGVALLLLFPLTAGVIGLAGNGFGAVGLVAMVTTLSAFIVALPGAVTHNYFRYVYPIVVPWLTVGVHEMLRRYSDTVAVAAIGVAIALLPLRRLRNDPVARESYAAARAVDDLVPEGAVVLVHDAGAISVFAHRAAVDMVGLKTPSSITAHRRWTWPSCGADRGDALMAILESSHAGYLVTIAEWERLFGIAQSLRARGVTLEPLRRPAGPDGYTIWKLKAE